MDTTVAAVLQAPEPVDPWDGTLDAGRDSRIRCVQKDDDDSQEDCLYLNVYTPDMDSRLPVMFWIHGGAFSIGDGRVWYGPEYFMDEDVVFVSANSRLGVLGEIMGEDCEKFDLRFFVRVGYRRFGSTVKNVENVAR